MMTTVAFNELMCKQLLLNISDGIEAITKVSVDYFKVNAKVRNKTVSF